MSEMQQDPWAEFAEAGKQAGPDSPGPSGKAHPRGWEQEILDGVPQSGGPHGGRDNSAIAIIGRWVAKLGPEGEREIRLAAYAWADRCQPPLDHAKIDEIVDRVLSYERRKREARGQDGDEPACADTEGIEREVVAAIVRNPDRLLDIAEGLEGEAFTSAELRRLYGIVLTRFEAGLPVTAGTLLEAGVSGELLGLLEVSEPAPDALPDLVNRLRDRALARRLAATLGRRAAEARRIARPPQELLAATAADLAELAQRVRDRRSPDLTTALQDARSIIARNEHRRRIGWPTGIPSLDVTTGGLAEGQLWAVGGYTSTGKSTLLAGTTDATARAGGRVAFFSTEMRRERIALRLVARLTETPVLRLLRGEYPSDLAARIRHAEETLTRWPVLLYDDARTMGEIRLRAKKAKLRGGLAVVIVDFVQNLHGEGSLYDRMSRAALEAQELAVDLDCAVVLASQVSNESVRASEDSPLIGYKGAGELAAAADVGLLLVPEREGSGADLRLEIRKGRDHGKGHLKLRFAGNWTRLEEA